jgi:tellurite resistance protein TerC
MTLTFLFFNLFIGLMLFIDLGIAHKNPHKVTVKESLTWSGIWIGMALIFSLGMFYFKGVNAGSQFLTGYIIEKSLSIDNIFLFVLIFRNFQVPKQYQHRVLFWGVIGALIMRFSLILLGSTLIDQYHWILYIFGAFLLITGVKMLLVMDVPPQDLQNNTIVKVARKFLPFTDGYHENKFYIIENGKRLFTPLFLVLILIEFTDLIFAVDSIPAIFAITTDPFIIYTSNAFASMGLRSLYFALADIIDKFRYLKYGLAIILIFIGAKMLVEPWLKIPSLVSLGVTVSILGVSVLYSVITQKTSTK